MTATNTCEMLKARAISELLRPSRKRRAKISAGRGFKLGQCSSQGLPQLTIVGCNFRGLFLEFDSPIRLSRPDHVQGGVDRSPSQVTLLILENIGCTIPGGTDGEIPFASTSSASAALPVMRYAVRNTRP